MYACIYARTHVRMHMYVCLSVIGGPCQRCPDHPTGKARRILGDSHCDQRAGARLSVSTMPKFQKALLWVAVAASKHAHDPSVM